jgi:hypothetical protein
MAPLVTSKLPNELKQRYFASSITTAIDCYVDANVSGNLDNSNAIYAGCNVFWKSTLESIMIALSSIESEHQPELYNV